MQICGVYFRDTRSTTGARPESGCGCNGESQDKVHWGFLTCRCIPRKKTSITWNSQLFSRISSAADLDSDTHATPVNASSKSAGFCWDARRTVGVHLRADERERVRTSSATPRAVRYRSGGVGFYVDCAPSFGGAWLGVYRHYCSPADQRSPSPRPTSSPRPQGKGTAHES
jgi:hypothetical protein